MCDYSLHHVRSRPAKVGDKLVTRNFGTGTRGFAAPDDATTAVCVLPGTELAFAQEPACMSSGFLGWGAEDDQAPDRDLPSGQQGRAAGASRRARISRRTKGAVDRSVRGPGGDRASASRTAGHCGRGRGAEARRLCRLKRAHVDGRRRAHAPEKWNRFSEMGMRHSTTPKRIPINSIGMRSGRRLLELHAKSRALTHRHRPRSRCDQMLALPLGAGRPAWPAAEKLPN